MTDFYWSWNSPRDKSYPAPGQTGDVFRFAPPGNRRRKDASHGKLHRLLLRSIPTCARINDYVIADALEVEIPR
jgi:hypothetical protein